MKGKLMGDGLLVLLTGDEFFGKVVEADTSWRCEEREKEQRRGLHQERTEALYEWKLKMEARTKAIQERRNAWEQEKIDWTAD